MNLENIIKKILREETDQDNYMRQANKKMELVRKFMKSFYPDFNREGTEVTKIQIPMSRYHFYTYRDMDDDTLYAKYTDYTRELGLDSEVFDMLETFLGEDLMTFVLEWFNEEFNQNAEHVSYL